MLVSSHTQTIELIEAIKSLVQSRCNIPKFGSIAGRVVSIQSSNQGLAYRLYQEWVAARLLNNRFYDLFTEHLFTWKVWYWLDDEFVGFLGLEKTHFQRLDMHEVASPVHPCSSYQITYVMDSAKE